MARNQAGASGFWSGGGEVVPTRAARVTVPSAQDLEIAKQDALLQLKIGRSAHYYIVLVSAALLIDGFMVLFLAPTQFGSGAVTIRDLYYVILPMVGGVYLSFFSLRLKWEDFQFWPWEHHFWATVGAVLLNIFVVFLFIADLAHVGPTANWSLGAWFYPLSLFAISAPMAALAMTWPGWPRAKLLSLMSALIPVAFGFVTLLPSPNLTTTVNALAVTLFAGAFLYQTSGSFLHLMASGTEPHAQATIVASQSRMFQLAEDVRRREDILRQREALLARRESEVQVNLGSIARQKESIGLARNQIDDIEREMQARSDQLTKDQVEWAAKHGEVNGRLQTLDDRESAIQIREEEVQHRAPLVAEREQRVVAKESEVVQTAATLSQRANEVNRRAQQVQDLEARLESRRQEVDKRSLELLQQESELRTRLAIAGTSTRVPDPLAIRTKDLETREARMAQLKMVLDEQNGILGRKAREAEAQLAEARQRSEVLAQREAALRQREGTLAQRESDPTLTSPPATERLRQLQERLNNYSAQYAELERRSAELTARKAELERQSGLFAQREALMKQREALLTSEQSKSDTSMQSLIERQKALEDREENLRLREAALEGLTAPVPAAAATTSRTPASRRSGFGWRRRGEMGSSSPPETEAVALPPPAATDVVTSPIAATRSPTGATARVPSDRQSTGIRRLDELLSGGVPSRSHLLLLGPPYIGKELVLYAFIAEGLRQGQPAVVVTTSRPPEEISAALRNMSSGILDSDLPSRMTWIDATGGSTSPKAASASAGKVVVNGPSDHAAILSSLVGTMKRYEGRSPAGIRVGFLGLPASLGGADSDGGFRFLQN
ncbi:MAG: ATPase domain-containing protein, partial [Thermoplasmata archaeon]